MIVEGVIAPGAHLGPWRRYALLDRGSYEVSEVEVPERIVRVAEEATSRRLAVVEARAVRLRAGDYVLAHHDAPFTGVEVVADLSRAAVPGAEVHWRRRGKVFLRMPGAPGAAAIVERDEAVACHHTYVSRRYGDVELVRMIVRLRERS